MKAVILAAGYATRLRPLTDQVPKQLLRVGGRPILDRLLDKVEAVDALDAVYVVTNQRFASDFDRWALGRSASLPVTVVDDGTLTNDDRLGAIGDIALTVRSEALDRDDLLVIAGDNLFDFDVADFVDFWRAKAPASAVAVYDVGDPELARQYGVVALDSSDRVLSFVEKPDVPSSTLAATATYLYHRDHVPLIGEYLREGNPPDQPGNLVAWLHSRRPVYGFRLPGEWFDIGTPEQLLEADNRLRAREGLPVREEYSLLE